MSTDAAPALPDLYVIRHGATEWSRNGRHTGRTDLPAAPRGRGRGPGDRPLLAGHSFALVLTSPCSGPAAPASWPGCGDQAEIDHDLCELDYGDYEGITTATIRETVPGWTVWDGAPAPTARPSSRPRRGPTG